MPPLLASLLLIAAGFGEKADLEILGKALKKALGEKTNYGKPRVLKLERLTVRGEDTLFIALQANRHVTSAGIRHGVLDDVASALRVARSWGWADKVARVSILEKILLEGENESRPLFACSISGQAMARVQWKSLNTKNVLQYLDKTKFYEMEK